MKQTRTRGLALALTALVLFSTIGAGVAVAQTDGDATLTPQTDAQISWYGGFTVPSDAVVTGGVDATPTWSVRVSDGDISALRSWANQSDSRTIQRASNQSNTATVAATPADMGVAFVERVTNSGLQHQTYVEQVALNRDISLAEPVSRIQTAEEFEIPSGAGIPDSDAFDTGGLAFREQANDTTLGEGREAVGADSVSATGEGTTIAVVDTGLNTAGGSVFGDRVLNSSLNAITNETVADEGIDAIADGSGHGTWVAAAAAADTSNSSFDGIAPDADLLAVKALGDDGSGNTADIAYSIRYAADHDADVIALSLGSPMYSEELADAVDYAFDQGVSAVTVATGNSRQTTRWVATPADVEGAIGVGATNTSRPEIASSATFSQIGPDPGTLDTSGGASQGATVDIAAPGVKLTALVPTESGSTSERTLSGTSMAQPLVAGGAAVMLDANPGLEGDEAAVRERLTETATPVPNAAEAEVGHGMLNVSNAVEDERPETSQSDAMNTAAEARNEFYGGISDASGGLIPWGAWAQSATDSLSGLNPLSTQARAR